MAEFYAHIAFRPMPAHCFEMAERGKATATVVEEICFLAESQAMVPAKLQPIEAVPPIDLFHAAFAGLDISLKGEAANADFIGQRQLGFIAMIGIAFGVEFCVTGQRGSAQAGAFFAAYFLRGHQLFQAAIKIGWQ